MAQMERIIRPHLPPSVAPPKTASKCYEPPENTVVKYKAPSAAAGGVNIQDNKDKDKPPKKPTEKTRNSSWSYAYKLYMTKKEKEEKKCEEDRVVGGAQATDVPLQATPTPTTATPPPSFSDAPGNEPANPPVTQPF